MASNRNRWLIALLAVVIVAGGYFAWQRLGCEMAERFDLTKIIDALPDGLPSASASA
jgi:hypothetical protein